MSDIRAILSSDSTIKAVVNTDHNLKAVLTQGVTVNQIINGGNSIHFEVPVSANNQQFSSDDLTQYGNVVSINLMKNGVYLDSNILVKLSSNTIQVNTFLNAGDSLDILATGSATISGGGGNGTPGGLNNQIQYNNNGNFAGDANFTFNRAIGTANLNKIVSTNINATLIEGVTGNIATLNTTTANLTNASISNLTLTSNLTAPNISTAGTVTANSVIANNIQVSGQLTFANATILDTTTTNTLRSNIAYLGTVSNVHIDGGTNGFVLQTDGTGNLSWTAQTGGGGGGGVPGGSNSQVQFNNNGSFGGASLFEYNSTTFTLRSPYTNTTITEPNQPQITNVGTLGNLTVTSNISAGNIIGTHRGDAQYLYNLNGSNVAGTVANAVYALNSGNTNYANNSGNATNAVTATAAFTAGTVTTAHQPNITSLGTLTNLNVTDTVTATNFIGNLTGRATTAGTVTSAAQPNITSVGNLFNLTVGNDLVVGGFVDGGTFRGGGQGLSLIPGANVTGTVANAVYATNAGNATNATTASFATSATTAGTVTNPNQPNITSVGALDNLLVTGTTTTNVLRTDNLQYSNGIAYTSYSNSNAQSFLPTYTGSLNPTNINVAGNLAVVGQVTVQQAKELVTIPPSAATANVNFDVLTQSILFYNAASATNTTLNIRGNSTTSFSNILNVNYSMTIVFISRVGVTPYVNNVLQIDGQAVTVSWINGYSPSVGTRLPSCRQTYTYTIIKTASPDQYTVFGSLTEYA